MSENICTVDGVRYKAAPSKVTGQCDGCTAYVPDDPRLCEALGWCFAGARSDGRSIVWIIDPDQSGTEDPHD